MADVPNPDPPVVDADDERRHTPASDALWNESWYFDVADPVNEVGAYLRFGLYPNLGRTWFQLAVVGRDRPLAILHDETAPSATGDGMHLVTGRWSCAMTIEEPLRRFHVGASGTADRFDDPATVYRGEHGSPLPVELDLTWTSAAPPYHYGVTTRYEVASQVTGTIRVGDEQIAVDAPGQRDHSWAVRDWWAFGWCWSTGALDDGTHFHLSDIRLPDGTVGFGYRVPTGGELVPAATVTATEQLGAHDFPTGADMTIDAGREGLVLAVTPIAFGPLVFTSDDGRSTHFPRALCAFRTPDGRTGTGWTEWNQVLDPP